MTNTIKIHLKDAGKLDLDLKHPLTFDDLLSVFMSITLGSMNKVVSDAPEEAQAECKGALYDLFNVAASKLLENFAPELELRPGLTAQAIKEAEDAIIMRGDLDKVAPGT